MEKTYTDWLGIGPRRAGSFSAGSLQSMILRVNQIRPLRAAHPERGRMAETSNYLSKDSGETAVKNTYRACPGTSKLLACPARSNPGTSSTSVLFWAVPSPWKSTRQAPLQATTVKSGGWGTAAFRPEAPLLASHSFPRNLHSPAETRKGPGVLRNAALSQRRNRGHVPVPHTPPHTLPKSLAEVRGQRCPRT